MAKKRLLLRADTSAGWVQLNPPLALNELVFDTTVQDFKRGDGVRQFNQLPYLIAPKVATTGGVQEWQPGIFLPGLVVVLYNFSLYQLTADSYPFDSQDIESEIEYGQWTPICCETTGGAVDAGLYLLDEAGRRILDENGQPITVD